MPIVDAIMFYTLKVKYPQKSSSLVNRLIVISIHQFEMVVFLNGAYWSILRKCDSREI